MKKLIYLCLLLPIIATAQNATTHTVGPKESITSIARLYNINGKDLANFNKIDYTKGLSIGQILKIPAGKTAAIPTPIKPNAVANPPKIVNASGTPIYYIVGKKETLYHVSFTHNKVPIEDIKKWNNLTSNGLSEGQKIIVGYTNDPTKAIPEPAIKNTEPPTKPVEKEEPIANKPIVENTQLHNFNGGFFKSLYEATANGKSIIAQTGTAGIFKSTSGWEDGKYYCLHNNAPAGTILKITNTANGKFIYAKVLDVIPDIQQNNGLIIRLSNAAADALGSTDNKLNCSINYYN